MQKLLCLLLLVLALVGQSNAQCSTNASCNQCFKASGCGWCVTDGLCMEGNSSGPTGNNECRGVAPGNTKYWYFAKSQIIKKTAGFPVNPVETFVYLKPNEPLDVPIQVTAPLSTDLDIDVMFLQDSSGSMADDITTFRSLATQLTNELYTLSKSAQVGLASFIEKPCRPQGYGRNYKNGAVDGLYNLPTGDVRNYVYKLEMPLSDKALLLETSLNKLTATSNLDYPEAALEAIGQVLTCGNIGWREGARKIVLVTTDAKFHHANDEWPSCAKSTPKCDAQYTCLAKPAWDGKCYGVAQNTKYLRTNFNYPSKEQIIALFKETNIIPVFAIAHNPQDPDSKSVSEQEVWKSFNDDIGFGVTLTLSPDSSNLINLILDALKQVNQVISLVVSSDPGKNVGGPITPTRYSNVNPGETVDFTLPLSTTSGNQNNEILLTSPGFGQAKVFVVSQFPCLDCAGVENGNAQWDKCGECAGADSCVGCDGKVPGPGQAPTVKDECGVCGGNNQCFKVCPNNDRDACGICGGDNSTCEGCDGIPNSGAVKDLCGECNGKNECIDCLTGVRALDGQEPTREDECGVCGGSNQCIGCDGVKYPPGADPPKYDSCGVCGGFNECRCDPTDENKQSDLCGKCLPKDDENFNICVGCDGIPYSKKVYDVCGVCDGLSACISKCDGLPNGKPPDACGICGGDGSTCSADFSNVKGQVRVAKEADETDETDEAAIGLYVGLALLATVLILAALLALFFFLKHRANPYWMVPSDMLNNPTTGVANNPLHKEGGGWTENKIGS